MGLCPECQRDVGRLLSCADVQALRGSASGNTEVTARLPGPVLYNPFRVGEGGWSPDPQGAASWAVLSGPFGAKVGRWPQCRSPWEGVRRSEPAFQPFWKSLFNVQGWGRPAMGERMRPPPGSQPPALIPRLPTRASPRSGRVQGLCPRCRTGTPVAMRRYGGRGERGEYGKCGKCRSSVFDVLGSC